MRVSSDDGGRPSVSIKSKNVVFDAFRQINLKYSKNQIDCLAFRVNTLDESEVFV